MKSYNLPKAAGLGQQLQAEGLGQAARRVTFSTCTAGKRHFVNSLWTAVLLLCVFRLRLLGALTTCTHKALTPVAAVNITPK